MKKTPLYTNHIDLNAKMVNFGGWEMPLQYTGIKNETLAVRQSQGIFDVSHMGEIFISGRGSGEFLDYILSRKISRKNPILTQYAFLCYEDGGVVDDLLVYQLAEEYFMLVVNAGNIDKDFAYIKQVLDSYQRPNNILLENLSSIYGLLAVQGQDTLRPVEKALSRIYPDLDFIEELNKLKRFRQVSFYLENQYLIVSRTGYTGEDGYEIYGPVEKTISLWKGLMELDLTPCGLGARDALRLEAGLPLYGHEISADINPLEAGLDRFVDLNREFIGHKMVNKKNRRLIALKATDRSIARENYKVFYKEKEIGVVTSGIFSPTLEKSIAFALVSASLPIDAKEVEVELRRKKAIFKITSTPFV